MKKNTCIILSLLSLSLFGCNKTNNTTSPSQSKSAETSTSKQDSASNKEETPKSETKSDSSKDSQESDDSQETSWPDDIAELMYKHLNKRYVPYIDLKPSNKKGYFLNWDRENSTLSIISNHREISSSMIQEAKNTYEKNGWEVTTTDEVMKAINQEKDLTVTFSLDYGLLSLIVEFDEKFDETIRDTYDEDVLLDLNNSMDNHADDIPYIYLGSINIDGEISDEGTYILKGGEWKDEILSIARNKINTVNNSISDKDYKWIVNTNTSYEYEIRRNLADGCSLRLKVSKVYGDINKDKNYAQLEITYKQKYTPSSEKSWNDAINQFFSNTCDNHSIPYFYLGSDDIEESSSSTYSVTYLASDNTWSDQIIIQAKNACTNEDINIQDEEYKWQFVEGKNSQDNTATLKATKNYSDGCSLIFNLSNIGYNQGDKAKLEIIYEPKYEEPENSSWSTDTKTLMTNHLKTNDIPYVYLGKQDEKTFYNETTKTLEITGSTYYSSVLKGAKSAFTKNNWTNEIKTVETSQNNETYTYQYFTAEKTIDDDTKLIVTVDGTMHSKYYEGGTSGYCIMKIELITSFTPPSGEDASWDKYNYAGDTVSNWIAKYLNGHTLPFVYLNTSSLELDYSTVDNTLSITGGKWKDELLSYAKNIFEVDDSWTGVNEDSENNTLQAECIEDDGCKLSATLSKTNSGFTMLQVKIESGFINVTEWSNDVTNGFNSILNNHVLPLIQLGSNTPNISTNDNFITLTTTAYKDTILSDAKASLENEGWTTFIDPVKKDVVGNNTYNYLISFKEFTDGIVYLYIYSNTNETTLCASYHSKPTNQTKLNWNENEKTAINNITENKLNLVPFLYMGNDDCTINTSTSKITGSTLDCYSIIIYYQKLNTLGYKDISLFIDSTNVNLTASYIDENNNEISITIKKNRDLRGTYSSLQIEYNSNN